MLSQDQTAAQGGTPDYPGFVPSEAEKALFADLAADADGLAAWLADKFEQTGSAPMVAASLAAHLMLAAAWRFSAVIRIAVDQCEPEPANFIGLAQDVTERTRFDIPSIRAAYADLERQVAREDA